MRVLRYMFACDRLMTAVLCALLIAGCRADKPTQIVVSVATNIAVPEEIDGITVRVEYQSANKADLHYDLDPALSEFVELPATIAINAGSMMSEPVTITVVGTKDDAEVIERRARLLFIAGRVLLLPMNLVARCADAVESCTGETTCTEEGCKPIDVDSKTLQDYEEERAFHTLDAAAHATTRDSGPDGGNADAMHAPTDAFVDALVDALVDARVDADEPQRDPCVPGLHRMDSPVEADLFSVWGNGPDDVWAVGVNGTVLHYDGTTWSDVTPEPGPRANYHAVWTIGDNVYAGGDGGTVSHFDGDTWKTMPTPTTETVLSIWGFSATDIFATTDQGEILHYNGDAWSSMAKPSQFGLYGIWGASANNVVAVGRHNEHTVWRFNGSTWDDEEYRWPGALYGIWGRSEGDIWAVGDNLFGGSQSSVLHYDGDAWEVVDNPGSNQLRGVATMGNVPIVVGNNGTVMVKTRDQWQMLVTGVAGPLEAVWAAEGRAFVVGARGAIFTYQMPWVPMPHTSKQRLADVWGTASNDVWAVGEGPSSNGNQNVLHFNGSEWKAQSPVGLFLKAVWASGPSDVYIMGRGEKTVPSILYRYDGEMWTEVMSIGHVMHKIWGNSTNDLFVVGDGARYHRDGDTWLPATPTCNAFSVWGDGSADVFVACANGSVEHYDGDDWSTMETSATHALYGVWGSGPADVYVVGDAGEIRHYDGETWEPMVSNTSIDLRDISGSAADDVVAVGKDGTILHYNGKSWKPSPSGADAGLYGIWADSAEDMFVVGDGVILRRCGGD